MQTDVLILAPHADDEVLGAGGLIARLSSEGKLVTVAIWSNLSAQRPAMNPAVPIIKELIIRYVKKIK